MLRFAGEAFAKASKPRVDRRISMSMLNVGVNTEDVFIWKKDGSLVEERGLYAYIHRIVRLKEIVNCVHTAMTRAEPD